MKWSETVASKCRYGDVAGLIWGDNSGWDVLWEESENDYQGYAAFFAVKGGECVFYEWAYGSCSGCDTWEAEEVPDAKIAEEMSTTAARFTSRETLCRWLDALAANPDAAPRGEVVSGNDTYGTAKTRAEGMRAALAARDAAPEVTP